MRRFFAYGFRSTLQPALRRPWVMPFRSFVQSPGTPVLPRYRPPLPKPIFSFRLSFSSTTEYVDPGATPPEVRPEPAAETEITSSRSPSMELELEGDDSMDEDVRQLQEEMAQELLDFAPKEEEEVGEELLEKDSPSFELYDLPGQADYTMDDRGPLWDGIRQDPAGANREDMDEVFAEWDTERPHEELEEGGAQYMGAPPDTQYRPEEESYVWDEELTRKAQKRKRGKEVLEMTNKPIQPEFEDWHHYKENDPWPVLPHDQLIKKLRKASEDPHFDWDKLSEDEKVAFVKGPRPASTFEELVQQKPWLANLGVPFDSLSPKAKDLALEVRRRGGRNRVIPPQNGKTVESFLAAIGKDVAKYAEKFESWEHLFLSRGQTLKEMDIPVRQRRHILNWIEKHKQGEEPFRIVLRSKAKKNKERRGIW